jgi:diaminohydroxyphosphoribosylaminopyrimidine deaminase/5-amino-6-(5-phosphoribosylamino)uracil reductase
MKTSHNFFSNLAFNLAENHIGKTGTNPSVGCVVVKDNSVISAGVTSINGRPHAEFNALNKNINFKDSEMYLTLEPCTHYGKTSPCTDLIKRKKIKQVYYCYDDPDLRTFKKAKKILKEKIKKINITSKNLDFYKSYYLDKMKKLPLIDAKIAFSKDNFTINRKSRWITNLRSRKVVHLIRSKYDCVISTSKSINKDNSLLNCRLDGFNKYKPDLIIIDRNLSLKKTLKLLDISKKRRTYLVTTSKNAKKISFFKNKKIKAIHLSRLKYKKDFDQLFQKLFQIGKRRILIESGLTFLKTIMNFKLLNNLYIFKSDKKLKKNGFNNIKISGLSKLSVSRRIRINLNNEKLYKVKIK